jgi:hypothetical protein
MSPERLIRYLLHHNLLKPADVLDRGVEIVEEVRERTILDTIAVSGLPTYMIKQGGAAEYRANIQQEIRVYNYLQGVFEVVHSLPPLIRGDNDQALLIMGWMEPTGPVQTLPEMERDGRLGVLVGRLHAESYAAGDQVGMATVPWVLSCLGREPQWRPPGLQSVVALVRSPEILRQGLQKTHALWRPDALIHGDLKQEHYMTVSRAGSVDICLLDWELAGYGDSAWDVGSMVSDLLFVRGYDTPKKRSRAMAGAGLGQLDALLGGYSDHVGAADEFFYRVALYTAARLFQTGIEAAVAYGLGPESGVGVVLSMAEEIYENPGEFALHLQRGAAG